MLLAGVSEDEERVGCRATWRLTLSTLRREGYMVATGSHGSFDLSVCPQIG